MGTFHKKGTFVKRAIVEKITLLRVAHNVYILMIGAMENVSSIGRTTHAKKDVISLLS